MSYVLKSNNNKKTKKKIIKKKINKQTQKSWWWGESRGADFERSASYVRRYIPILTNMDPSTVRMSGCIQTWMLCVLLRVRNVLWPFESLQHEDYRWYYKCFGCCTHFSSSVNIHIIHSQIIVECKNRYLHTQLTLAWKECRIPFFFFFKYPMV